MADLPREVADVICARDECAWARALGVSGPQRELALRSLELDQQGRVVHGFARPDLVWTSEGWRIVEGSVAPALGGINTHDPYVDAVRESASGRHLLDSGVDLVAALLLLLLCQHNYVREDGTVTVGFPPLRRVRLSPPVVSVEPADSVDGRE